jgi:hypothetical protein
MLLQPPGRPASVLECLHSTLRHHSSEPLPEEVKLKNSRFTAYVILQGISAVVCEKQQLGQLNPGSTNFNNCFDALMCWYRTFERSGNSTNKGDGLSSDVFCLMVLWHTIFINLLVDVNCLERAVGREGAENASAESDYAYTRKWATSVDAQRCVFHAYALQKIISSMPLDVEPAIHVPHCMFVAGVIAYACNAFRRPAWKQKFIPNAAIPVLATTDYPEFILRGIPISKLLQRMPSHSSTVTRQSSDHGNFSIRYQDTPPPNSLDHSVQYVPFGGGLLRLIADMLWRIGHWGIARKYLETLEMMVCADLEEWMVSS